ncbi:unnamed protein product [Cyclocybe aegerita]|uniref:Nephrocystin 3-like N-terminal domain-containing protein n=1 Tax=Cyclocybe aegerita TaxID=1973307 RepID=A0A8S0W9L4_CYCAE|nr:unnamed protein product [Cyclocybe aegerita]
MSSMFKGARNVQIQDSSFVIVDNHGMNGLQLLHREVVYGATHDSAERYPPPKCHPKTRRAIVTGIMDWILDLSRLSSILWLRGPAGCGKTAISQTICELCQATRALGGSFFFSRHSHGRNNSTLLFVTIAYQLAVAIPEVGVRISEIVANDPSIVTKSIDVQLRKLIVEPLQLVELSARPVVIVIDGLDECLGESMQRHIVQLIGSVFEHGIFPVCFVIASRPEPWIKDEFESGLLTRNLRQVALEEANGADEDIRTFLMSGFEDICNSPSHRTVMSTIPKPWPSGNDIDSLVDRASGQFIYPATVLKFVDDPHFRPIDRLQDVLAIPMATTPSLNPFFDLDQLYTEIMLTCADKQRTLDVLGTLLVMLSDGLPLQWGRHPGVLDVVEQLLGLRSGESQLALRTIHSLVHVSSLSAEQRETMTLDEYRRLMRQQYDAVKFYHKTFSDFLLDSSRSKDYFINSVELSKTQPRITKLEVDFYSEEELFEFPLPTCVDLKFLRSTPNMIRVALAGREVEILVWEMWELYIKTPDFGPVVEYLGRIKALSYLRPQYGRELMSVSRYFANTLQYLEVFPSEPNVCNILLDFAVLIGLIFRTHYSLDPDLSHLQTPKETGKIFSHCRALRFIDIQTDLSDEEEKGAFERWVPSEEDKQLGRKASKEEFTCLDIGDHIHRGW